MTQPKFDIRRTVTFVALATFISLYAACSRAADGAERPFNPPVGSRWIIESHIETDDVRPDSHHTSEITSRAEVTIEAKTADGFRITYVHRGTTAEGNAPEVPLVRTAMRALDGVPIRATTDARGNPVRVDNLDEAKGAIRNMFGTITAPLKDKPQVVAVLNQIAARLTEVDADKAAATYLDELPQLAKAQGTGMKQGDVRRSTDAVENPLGGTMKSNSVFELKRADAATGKRLFVNATSYDADSLKAFTQGLSKKLMVAGGSVTPEQVDGILKQMVLTLDERAEFEVEDGMTRKITETSVTVARALGHDMRKTETRTVTMTAAP